MAPNLDGMKIATVNKTVHLGPVTGGRGWNRFTERSDRTIKDDEFAEAITQALLKSRLFAHVGKGRAGDYRLKAHIINQGSMVLPVDAGPDAGMGKVIGAIFVVRYTVETPPGKEVFQKEIGAGCDSERFLMLPTYNQIDGAVECAVQNNLRKLIRELARVVENRSARLDLRH